MALRNPTEQLKHKLPDNPCVQHLLLLKGLQVAPQILINILEHKIKLLFLVDDILEP